MLIGLAIGTVSCTGRSNPQSPSPSADAPPAERAARPPAEPDPQTQPSTALNESTEPQEAIAPTETTLDETDIWSRLHNADDTHYYVLMRHALAPGTGDPSGFQLNDCSTQRNLSEEGRDQARRTGEAFRENNVTVQHVLSSEWCRCLDTAELLDLGPVERFSGLNSFFQDRAKRPQRTAQLREFMLANQEEYGVTVLVTHFVNISAIAGSGVSSGEMVVMQINDQNEPEVVDRIDEF